MKLGIIHPPFARSGRPVNWAAWMASGTVVGHRYGRASRPPRLYPGIVVVSALIMLVAVPMLVAVLS